MMPECSNGHDNPVSWEVCGYCGAPVSGEDEVAERAEWDRLKWTVAGIVVFTATVLVCGIITLAVLGSQKTGSPPSASTDALQQWATESSDAVTELEQSLDDAQQALDAEDRGGLQTACDAMHQAAAVTVPAHLPTPDAELTSELTAAAQDGHDAAHMCLAAMAGSVNSYNGEFLTAVDAAIHNVALAQRRIKQVLAIPGGRPAA